MIKMIFTIKRKPGMSPEAFREHYENVHVKIAEKYFGDLILDYRRNYAISFTRNPVDNAKMESGGPNELGYDVITQMTLADQAALDEMFRRFASPELHDLLAEDEERFMDRPALTAIMCEEVVSWREQLVPA